MYSKLCMKTFDNPKDIYDYVKENIKYKQHKFGDTIQGSKELINSKEGDCWEVVNLIQSLYKKINSVSEIKTYFLCVLNKDMEKDIYDMSWVHTIILCKVDDKWILSDPLDSRYLISDDINSLINPSIKSHKNNKLFRMYEYSIDLDKKKVGDIQFINNILYDGNLCDIKSIKENTFNLKDFLK